MTIILKYNLEYYESPTTTYYRSVDILLRYFAYNILNNNNRLYMMKLFFYNVSELIEFLIVAMVLI